MSDDLAIGLAGEKRKQGCEPLHPPEPDPLSGGDDPGSSVEGLIKENIQPAKARSLTAATATPMEAAKTWQSDAQALQQQNDAATLEAIDNRRIEHNLANSPELRERLEQLAQAGDDFADIKTQEDINRLASFETTH